MLSSGEYSAPLAVVREEIQTKKTPQIQAGSVLDNVFIILLSFDT